MIKNKIAFAIGCFGLVFAACGDNSTGANENDKQQSSDSQVIGDLLSSSSLDSAVEESSSSDLISEISSSSLSDSVAFDSSYVGDTTSVSSGTDLLLSSSSKEAPESSASETTSSSSEKVYPKYDKILGADVSQAQELEAKGVKFFDVDGREKDLFVILRDHGFNYIRLKTFVDPKAEFGYASDGCDQGFGEFPQNVEAFGDKEHVVAYAKRAKALGFKLLLDFHYSDNWADPGKQMIPARWRHVKTSDEMADSVKAYTKDVLKALEAAGALPDMVQVGNEITNGMLSIVPNGKTNCWGDNGDPADGAVNGLMNNKTNPNGIANTAKYLAAGYDAVKEISNNIKVAFHISSPQKLETVNWWMKSIIQDSEVSPDIMAFSGYKAYNHGDPDSWKALMIDLGKTYTNLEFMIAEYNGGTDWEHYAYDGSRAKTHQIMDEVPRGLGAFFWEPERSGEWGPAMFEWQGNNLKAIAKAFDEYKVLFY